MYGGLPYNNKKGATTLQKLLKIEFVSWNKITHLSYLLANKIAVDKYRPDLVISIARGGYVPARLLCDYLDIYNLTSIRITHYLEGSIKIKAAKLSIPLKLDISGMNILLVDDVDDSGETLQLALEHIKRFNPAQIKVAVLHHKQISTITPDYYAQKIVKWRWITYPWAIVEDVQGFIKQLDPKPANVQTAIDYFFESYRIRIPLEVMEQAFKNI
jgi:hypoxanthine phosphoribosyltransferase